jgi:hypothetical protein
VGAGLVGAGLVGAGLVGLAGLAGAVVGRVVVGEDDGLDPGCDVGGTVTAVPELELVVRTSVPLDRTVNQLFAKACPAACDSEWSPTKK